MSKSYSRVVSAMEEASPGQISGRFVLIINPLETSGVARQGETAEDGKVEGV